MGFRTVVSFLSPRALPEGAIAVQCLAAEIANDAIVPTIGVVNGSEIHVVDVAAGFGVHYNGHWYNLASGAVVK